MRRFSSSPIQLVSSLFRNLRLVDALTRREFAARYRGSIVGILWSVVLPLVMLAIYTFAFRVAFTPKTSWGGSNPEFALVLFAGLLMFNVIAECLNRAPMLIHNHISFVKKVIFPIEILPLVLVCSALIQMIIGFSVWIVFYAFIVGIPHLTVLFFPFLLIPLALFSVGISMGLSAVGVFIRDLSQMTAVLTTILMFVSPVFFSADAIPERFRWVVDLNPLAWLIEACRKLLISGDIPQSTDVLLLFFVSFAVCWLGYFIFQRTRIGFADVL